MTEKLTLLIVEDNDGDADLIKFLLADVASVEFKFHRAQRLSQGLDLCKNHPPDLVFLDLNLPDSSGIETVKNFCQAAPWVPVVVLTGDTDETLGMAALKSGAQEYLVKGNMSSEFLLKVLRYAIERHNIHEQLRLSEQFLKAALNSLTSAIAILDSNGVIIKVNQTWRNFASNPALEVITGLPGKNYFESLANIPENKKYVPEKLSNGIQEVMAAEKHKFEMDCLCKSSHKNVWFHFTAIPFMNIDHKNVVISFKNITELMMAREEIRDSELRLQTMLDAQTSMVILRDLDHNVIWANLRACDTAGIRRSDIIGKKCVTIWNDATPVCETCPIREVINTNTVVSRDRLWRGGKTLLTTGYPIRDKDGNIISVLEVSNDITKSLAMEEKLRQAQKMESLGTLAGGIAHDFNNILSVIMGYTTLARINAKDNEAVKEDLQEIYKASQRAGDLVRQILTFSRRADTDLMPLNISLIIKEALKMLRATLPTTIEIKTDIDTNICPTLADPTQIHQIVMNLCTNAAHAMEPEGGILSVTLTEVELTGDDIDMFQELNAGPFLKLSISDTGCGIAPEIMDSIFDPYFTTKELGEGTGLGLAVVHGIIKDYGGEIKVTSNPPEGSRFDLYFRVVKQQTLEQLHKEDDIFLPKGHATILVVDDEPSITKMVGRILEQHNYEVIQENNSMAAVKRFKSDPDSIDLVITDMTMPHLTGDKLAEQVHQINPQTPVILMTGYSNKLSKINVDALDIDALIMKPMSRSNIVLTVNKLLDKGENNS